jgi:hypothetical protein
MRDLNDAVLDNPFDHGIKGIATSFAELLRGIVKTIDRWGLKSLFLRKHQVGRGPILQTTSKDGRGERDHSEMEWSAAKGTGQAVHFSKARWGDLEQQ